MAVLGAVFLFLSVVYSQSVSQAGGCQDPPLDATNGCRLRDIGGAESCFWSPIGRQCVALSSTGCSCGDESTSSCYESSTCRRTRVVCSGANGQRITTEAACRNAKAPAGTQRCGTEGPVLGPSSQCTHRRDTSAVKNCVKSRDQCVTLDYSNCCCAYAGDDDTVPPGTCRAVIDSSCLTQIDCGATPLQVQNNCAGVTYSGVVTACADNRLWPLQVDAGLL
jgi:hypothetical protein